MQALPFYLAIGMSNAEFWDGDPMLAKAYREAYEIQKEMRNEEMWIQGLYNYRGFKAVIEGFGYGLSQGKGAKPSEYPPEPFAFTKREKEKATERNKQRTLKWVQENQR